MTEHEQQIAIAEHQGWSSCRLEVRGAGAPEREPSPYGVPPGRGYRAPLPDYLHDLNEMHKSEISLFPVDISQLVEPDRWKEYREVLEHICVGHAGGAIRATASQRAEAFLRTVGKWRED